MGTKAHLQGKEKGHGLWLMMGSDEEESLEEHVGPEILLGPIFENTVNLSLHCQKKIPWLKCLCFPKIHLLKPHPQCESVRR